MGDPETQAVLPLLDSDLLTLTEDAIQGKPLSVKWKNEHSCCVVMVSGGYPQSYEKGHEIKGLDTLDTPFFIAGAKEENDKLLTSGGRVLNIVALGKTAQEAREKVYKEVEKVHFDKAYFRQDIGKTNT